MHLRLIFILLLILEVLSGSTQTSRELWGDTLHVPKPQIKRAESFQFTDKGTAAIKYLTDRQKLSITNVLSIYEDHTGTVWLGGTNGNLVSFDGVEFKEYNNIDPLRGKGIYKIAQDKENRLWLASFGGGVHCFNGQHLISYSDQNCLPGERLKVLDLLPHSDGSIWIATIHNGVIQMKDNQYIQYLDGLPHETINSIYEDPSGSIWAGGYNGRISIFNGSSWQPLEETRYEFLGAVFDFEWQDDGMWVAGGSGLNRIEPSGASSFWIEGADLPFSYIRDIEIARDGDLLLGTYGGGLVKWNPERFEVFDKSDGTNEDHILSLMTDSDGILWIGTYGSGVMRYLGQTFRSVNLGDAHPWSVCRDGDRILIGTDGDGIKIFDLGSGEIKTDTAFSQLSGERVYDIAKAPNGDLWIGTANGAYKYDDLGKITHLNNASLLLGTDVRCFAEGPNNTWGIGTSKGLTFISDEQTITIDKPQGLKSHDIYEIQFAHDHYWVCTNDGLALVSSDLKKVQVLDQELGLPSSTVFDIDFNDQGEVWLACYGGGIAFAKADELIQQLDQGQSIAFTILTEKDGLNSNNTEAVRCIGSEVWIGNEFGLNLIWKKGDKTLNIRSYNQKDGIRNNHIISNNVLNVEDHLYWCTDQDLLCYDHRNDLTDETAPLLHLEALELYFEDLEWCDMEDDRIYPASSYWQSITNEYIYFEDCDSWHSIPLDPTFSYDQNHLTFKYAGINWKRGDLMRYRYRLVNHEDDWQPITGDRKCTYQNLDPGSYIFEVQCINGEGLWSPSVHYSFEIMPPFWATTWFRILMMILAGLAVYGMVRWRIRKLQKENLVLDMKVKERTQELAKEKEKSEELLLNILPKQTAYELKKAGKATTRNYESASVLFSDFKGFTQLTETVEADDLVVQLDAFFRSFDKASDAYKIEKIKTIGDAYMCASGIPKPTQYHAHKLVAFGLQMLSLTNEINQGAAASWPIRIGIHSGPLIAGVVGLKKFAYDIWGDTVNLASRMESSGEPGKLNISESTKILVEDVFIIEARGQIKAKNKGELDMYFVHGFKPEYASKEDPLIPNHRFLHLIRQEDVKHL